MNSYKILIPLLVILLGCGNNPNSRFPMEKRFWTPEDYDEVTLQIQYYTPEGERFPELKNPVTSPVFKKMIDRQNFLVVLDDEQLGVRHRNEVASEFFNEYRDLVRIYYSTDRQDKYVYGAELIEILKFGLELQIHYFKLGNEAIISEADDPNASNIRYLVSSNEDTAIKNYNSFLDLVNNESSFNETEIESFAEGIDTYFPKLFEVFPKGNLNITKKKAELMLKKAENERVRKSLDDLLSLIQELSEEEKDA